MKESLTIFLLFLYMILIPLQELKADDSIPATDLQELVVKSNREWFENGVYTVIPSKKEKQLAVSPGSLIDIMCLPMLKGDGENIKTTSNEKVSIFINGVPASATDIANFWPKNVKKVEYLVNPSDPKYLGATQVVDFIVAEYEVGGVSRASVSQTFPNNGQYRLSSRLDYKRMTFGALVSYNYNKPKAGISQEDITYHDLYYEGMRYDEICQSISSEEKAENKMFDFGFNARYITQRFRATHNFSLGWFKNMIGPCRNENSWSENLFNSDASSSYLRTRSLSPQLSGSYYYKASNKWVLGAIWNYAYSGNKDYSWNQFGENPWVETGLNEKVNTLGATVYANFFAFSKVTFQFLGQTKSNWFSSVYNGSNDEITDQYREELTARLSVFWNPSNRVNLVFSSGLLQNCYKLDEIKKNYMAPYISLYGGWNPNGKLNMSLSAYTGLTPAQASSTNPVMIRNSDLMWLEGNPMLKPKVNLEGRYTLNYKPIHWLAFNWVNMYSRAIDEAYFVYRPAPLDMGGIIRSEANASPGDCFLSMFNAYVYLLDRKLSISASPTFRYIKSRGEYDNSFHSFSYSLGANYMLGNCYISAKYSSRIKDMSQTGDFFSQTGDRLDIGVSYSINDFNFGCDFHGLLGKRLKSWQKNMSNVYSAISNYFSYERRVQLSVTYTIGYGKKIDRMIDVEGSSSIESSRLSSFKER